MVYLILDTNIWLYLSNGFDSINNNYTRGLNCDHHFDLLYSLQDKIDAGEIEILINDVILQELARHEKDAAQLISEISKHEKELIRRLDDYKPYLSENMRDHILKEIKHEISLKAALKIEENKKHIDRVKEFIKHCKDIPVKKEHYTKAAELAISKKAPFHNNKNNIADAVILLSVIDYLIEIPEDTFTEVVFISNNVDEFAKDKAAKIVVFHDDIVELLGEKRLTYKRQLNDAIELSDEVTQQLYEYWQELEEFKRSFFDCIIDGCGSTEFPSIGVFNAIKVLDTNNFSFQPNQTTLFKFTEEERKNLTNVRQAKMGYCSGCGVAHLVCPNCDEFLCDPEGDKLFVCTECNSEFKIKHHPLLDEEVLAYSELKLRSKE